jgi:hypothetical protein
MTGELVNAALDYASRGWPVFPCKWHSKAPATANGFHDATIEPQVIRAWWGRHPDYNVAIATGAPAIDVFDVDVHSTGAGWESFNRAKCAGLLAGALALVTTPSTGLHLYFRGTTQHCTRFSGQHIDVKASGGYVLAPPSYAVTDDYEGPYVLLEDRSSAAAGTLDVTALRALLIPPRPVRSVARTSHGNTDALADWLARQTEGNRNSALFWAACRALDAGHEDLDELRAVALSLGLAEPETDRTLQSARRNAVQGVPA